MKKKSLKPISERQRQIHNIVCQGAEHGKVPTVRELCAMAGGVSTNAINSVLEQLERKGFIEREPLTARGITVIKYANGSPFYTAGEANVRLRDAQERIRELEACVWELSVENQALDDEVVALREVVAEEIGLMSIRGGDRCFEADDAVLVGHAS